MTGSGTASNCDAVRRRVHPSRATSAFVERRQDDQRISNERRALTRGSC